MSIKRALLDYEEGSTVEEVAKSTRFSQHDHLHHCIEILRQVRQVLIRPLFGLQANLSRSPGSYVPKRSVVGAY